MRNIILQLLNSYYFYNVIINYKVMKFKNYLFFLLFAITSFGIAQTLESVDFVSNIHDNVIAVKKGNQWAFLNSDGKIAVSYRADLVKTSLENNQYPMFQNDRCLITHKKDGITYFGYIDKTGKTVIETKFLNASNFQNNTAIVLLLERTEISNNAALKKPVVSYDYFEVVIDLNGNVLKYLNTEPVHITLSSNYLQNPPPITSKFISNTLLATKNRDNKWSVIKLD